MVRRVGYTVLTLSLLALSATFGFRLFHDDEQPLPAIEQPAEIAGLSCQESLNRAQDFTKNANLESAGQTYLWVITNCDSSPLLPDALFEGGSLFGHLLQKPAEARQIYKEFLRRFPTHAQADAATYHLAKLEIDAGDYPSAVAHLTLLAERYPNSSHQESAKFLAAKTAEMLAAERRSLRTVLGQLRRLVPNNMWSFVVLLGALGPAALETIHKSRNPSVPHSPVLPMIILALTLLNYFINNVESSRQNRQLMKKLDLLEAVDKH